MTRDPDQGMEDRRDSARRAVFSDGNGGPRTVVYSFAIKRANAIAGLVLAILGIGGVVLGAVRIGVQSEVHAEFEHQIDDPRSDLNRHLRATFSEACALGQEGTAERLRGVETNLAVLESTVKKQTEEITELRRDVKELLRREASSP